MNIKAHQIYSYTGIKTIEREVANFTGNDRLSFQTDDFGKNQDNQDKNAKDDHCESVYFRKYL